MASPHDTLARSMSGPAPLNPHLSDTKTRIPNATPAQDTSSTASLRLSSSIPTRTSRQSSAPPSSLKLGSIPPITPGRPSLPTQRAPSTAGSVRSTRTTSLQFPRLSGRSEAGSQRAVSLSRPKPIKTQNGHHPDVMSTPSKRPTGHIGNLTSPVQQQKDTNPALTFSPVELPSAPLPVPATPEHRSPSASKSTSRSPLPAVPWSSSGALQSSGLVTRDTPDTTDSPAASRQILLRRSRVSTANGSFLEGHDVDADDITYDMSTEVDSGYVDEDMAAALDEIKTLHSSKITHFKRLLERSQASAASQFHALNVEIRMLRETLEVEKQRKLAVERQLSARQLELQAEKRSYHAQIMSTQAAPFDILSTMRGDGKGGFDEIKIRAVIKSLAVPDRMRLLHIILDACLPGDIPNMIAQLQKYARSTFDILTHLPPTIASRILTFLPIPDLLSSSLTSRSWNTLVHDPTIWRYHCLSLTRTDPSPVRAPADPAGWETLYKSLYHREQNWKLGLCQNIRFFKGHTGFVTTLLLKGKRLISGSYDETIRVWDIETGEEKKRLKVKAVSCLDYLAEEEIFAAGFHDIGRVQVFSSVTWTPLQTLQGHLYGIRAVALSSTYLVSAGADKAIVCWDWRAGTKIVRFGQQTNLNIGVQIVDEERVISVTVDGIVRVFSIRHREMVNQFKLSELGGGDPVLSARIFNVGRGADNMLQWFAAKGGQMTCATKNLILHLQWSEDAVPLPAADPAPSSPVNGRPSLPSPVISSRRSSLAFRPDSSPTTPTTPLKPLGQMNSGGRPSISHRASSAKGPRDYDAMAVKPRIIAVLDTPDVSVGAVDPQKRRVATSTRFSSRLGADRRVFVSTFTDRDVSRIPNSSGDEDGQNQSMSADSDESVIPIVGAWAALADEPTDSSLQSNACASLPSGFKGLATPGMNPMVMTLTHEEVVVGCTDGTIYSMSFVGYGYKSDPNPTTSSGDENGEFFAQEEARIF